MSPPPITVEATWPADAQNVPIKQCRRSRRCRRARGRSGVAGRHRQRRGYRRNCRRYRRIRKYRRSLRCRRARGRSSVAEFAAGIAGFASIASERTVKSGLPPIVGRVCHVASARWVPEVAAVVGSGA
ncbi:hypothetical protein KP509_06G047700 [Ceratopteris richardii]|uniref:Uncharacterized protein n=1 Tax=Ceratopteris richardii TaxID=49495 RepID=A0A8T2UME4_CERRI|nr:hypothetical protein KP509_06G047700 [Ceratopteris richardii]